MPDGGLFTPDQILRGADEPPPGQVPARGAIECKKPKDKLLDVVDSPQVSRYWDRFNQVLVTNYREFLLVGRDESGTRVRGEHFRLADSERAFWAADPAELAATLGDPLLDFLRRCLLRPAPLTEPKDVAWFLASYARDAKSRVERSTGLPALAGVRTALEQTLGISFEDAKDPEKGARFFRSTLVQTLFYGVFSAWVLWHHAGTKPGERFDWEKSAKYLRVPVLRKLFHELADPGNLQEWKLDEVLGWTGDVLVRVDRAQFFSKFPEAEAVQYFYEPFLEQFDPELRKALGVWYTPPEIVQYMVGRVDHMLKTTLGRPEGLADESVYVLDPCCGTGAFLVEVLRHIDAALREKSPEDASRAAKLKQAVTTRLFGFELLPAPFVVAHLQVGLLLRNAPLDDRKKERAGIFLTNALTGWEPPTKVKRQVVLFDEFDKERDLADEVKQKKPILVVLGNPPYNGFAGVAVGEERSLSDSYRWKDGDPTDLRPQGQGLNELYVRFFRMAEQCILGGQEGEGVVCFVSGYSWLDGLSFPLMRERFLREFDAVWVDCLNGDKYRTGKLTPDGAPDPSAFSTERNPEGIQVGTAITLMVRKKQHVSPAAVWFRDFWGLEKLKDLAKFGSRWSAAEYVEVTPSRALGLPFRPLTTDADYGTWPLIADLFAYSSPGVKTSRDLELIEIDREILVERMQAYFDGDSENAVIARIAPGLMESTKRFDARKTRAALIKQGYTSGKVLEYSYRPFDTRYLYWHPQTKLLDEKRDQLFHCVEDGNWFLTCRQKGERTNEGSPFYATPHLPDWHLTRPGSMCFPLKLRAEKAMFSTVNVSKAGRDYLAALGIPDPDANPSAAGLLWHYVLAIGHSEAYLAENEDGLWQDWPRVPLPGNAELLRAAAELGRQVIALLDPAARVEGVTTGKTIRAELRVIGVLTRVGGKHLDPASGDLDLEARWGIRGKDGICMPGPGEVVEREYTTTERAALGERLGELGPTTFDVFLNERAFWRNVPARVWRYTLGGYQVVKKWLSYRDHDLLGRGLKLEEAEYVRDLMRRIAALRLLGPALDLNYATVKTAALRPAATGTIAGRSTVLTG